MSNFDSLGSVARRIHLKRRFDKNAKPAPQSPSFGVRRGLIRNPNWPPPPGVEMPTDRRLSPRVRYGFDLLYAGRPIAVAGDLSATGAMFVMERLLPTARVELVIRVPNEPAPRRVSGDIIRTSYKGQFIAHHVRFVEPTSVFDAMQTIMASGAVRV